MIFLVSTYVWLPLQCFVADGKLLAIGDEKERLRFVIQTRGTGLYAGGKTYSSDKALALALERLDGLAMVPH